MSDTQVYEHEIRALLGTATIQIYYALSHLLCSNSFRVRVEGFTVKPTRSSWRTTAVLDSHGRHPGAAAYAGKAFRIFIQLGA